ncbi:MAG: hypothetical protein LBQ15_01975 [Clostridium sp.]|jgi:hypothetical protein|nr:hypothetical protein [Clostridium sp.]
MSEEEKPDKYAIDFNRLPEDSKRYILEIRQALIFAQHSPLGLNEVLDGDRQQFANDTQLHGRERMWWDA